VNFSNYADFRNRVQVMLDGDDISTSDLSVSVLDTIIGLGEQRIYRDLRSSTQDTALSLATTGNAVTLPADFLELRGAPYVGTFPVAIYAPWEAVTNSININQDTSSNRIVYYSFQSDKMIFFPVQTTGTTVTGQYYKRFSDISGGLNALFNRHPDIFMYAALAESGPFMGETTRTPVWEQKYVALVQDANEQERRRYTRGGKLQTRVA
jgi:hypothetical protein